MKKKKRKLARDVNRQFTDQNAHMTDKGRLTPQPNKN